MIPATAAGLIAHLFIDSLAAVRHRFINDTISAATMVKN
jgi:hypothetical protein